VYNYTYVFFFYFCFKVSIGKLFFALGKLFVGVANLLFFVHRFLLDLIGDENQKDVINRRNGQGPKHLKFFLLVFTNDEAQAQESPWYEFDRHLTRNNTLRRLKDKSMEDN